MDNHFCYAYVYEYPEDRAAFDGSSNDLMDRDDYSLAMTMQYDQLGLDNNGAPTRATLERLGLGYVADDMAIRGLLGA